SLDGGAYQLYALFNPSLAGSGGGDTGAWDAAGAALVASDGQPVFGQTVASALKSSAAFTTHTSGYSGTSSDGLTDLRANKRLTGQYDTVSSPGNIVQAGQVPVGADTTFTLALGFGADRTAAASAATASLSAGFAAAESSYGSG